MIDLFELYQSFQSYVNTFQGGWFRPQSDFQRACNDISNQLWNEWTSQAEISKEVKDNLRYFLKSENIKVVTEKSSFGRIDVPKDYGRSASLRVITDGKSFFPSEDVNDGKCDGFETDEERAENYYDSIIEVNVDVVDNSRWGAANKHLTKKPKITKPLATQIGQQDGSSDTIRSGFKISPRDVSVVVLDYYIKPRDAVFAYTITPGNLQTGAGDQIVYDKSRSKPLQWPETMIGEFLVRLGERYGAFTRDQFMAQFSTQQKKTA